MPWQDAQALGRYDTLAMRKIADFDWIVKEVADLAIAKAKKAPYVPELRWAGLLGAKSVGATAKKKKPAKKAKPAATAPTAETELSETVTTNE